MLRTNRYRKEMISRSDLTGEAVELHAKLAPFIEMHEAKTLSDAEFTACYILLFVLHRRKKQWKGAKMGDETSQLHESTPKPLTLGELPFEAVEKKLLAFFLKKSIFQVFTEVSLRSIPKPAQKMHLEWAQGKIDLVMSSHPPQPIEVLDLQVQRRRCITVVTDKLALQKYILDQRDPLGFVLHDLMHADRFFGRTHWTEGQIGFFKLLHRAHRDDIFAALVELDPRFKRELDYISGDMNSFSIHMLQCLKTACQGALLRKHGQPVDAEPSEACGIESRNFWKNLCDLWEMPRELFEHSLEINSPKFGHSESQSLADFFEIGSH